jgi:hypothetical protein
LLASVAFPTYFSTSIDGNKRENLKKERTPNLQYPTNPNQKPAMRSRLPIEEILQGVFDNSPVEIPGRIERKNKISFVVSDFELETINNSRGRIKLSEYLRTIIFQHKIPRPRPPVPAINRQTLVQLNRIGGLINQQARVLNLANQQNTLSQISPEYLQYCLNNLEQLRSELKQIGRQIVLLNAGMRTDNDWENL